MINNERVKYMTKLAEYENGAGKEDKKATQYFRKDYVAMEMIKSFVTGTVAFGLMFMMWLFYNLDNLMQKINDMDLVGFATEIVIIYLVFLAVYLLITYIIYNARYTSGRKHAKEFFNGLKKVSNLYEEEEKTQSLDDWED